ncbi:tail fiber protein [Ignatzschineria larvae DSM 13226]|uniref:Tail fiber protein n=1 Tax=Ignatzschineria larvae DSM 13226 TaxID=1111732 RepID=A0ABZ3BZ33_9GAMM|nr:tail fiber protein [Ignatzschineria larvae]
MEIVKQPDFQVFASEAKTGEVLKFPDILRGWGVTLEQTQGKPPLEWMNDAFKRIDVNNLYHLQQGIPEWHKSVRYPESAVVKNNGKIYICLAENENNEPHLNSEKWSLLITKATTSQQGIVQLTSALTDREDLAVTPKMVNDISKLANNNANTRLEKSKNLSDLTNVTVARNNLGLGTSATLNSTSSLSDRTDQAATIKVVNDVNRTANNAQTSANTANDKANAAQTTANQAKSAAATADSKAVKAQSTADTANTNATNAKKRADSAYTLAEQALPQKGNLSTTNLDTLNNSVHVGVYFQTANANATIARNYPTTRAGTLFVLDSAGVTQIYIAYNGINEIYTRNNYGNKWSAWASSLKDAHITNVLGNSKSLVASQALVKSVDSKTKPITEGGTGATTAANARKNLGIDDLAGTMRYALLDFGEMKGGQTKTISSPYGTAPILTVTEIYTENKWMLAGWTVISNNYGGYAYGADAYLDGNMVRVVTGTNGLSWTKNYSPNQAAGFVSSAKVRVKIWSVR